MKKTRFVSFLLAVLLLISACTNRIIFIPIGGGGSEKLTAEEVAGLINQNGILEAVFNSPTTEWSKDDPMTTKLSRAGLIIDNIKDCLYATVDLSGATGVFTDPAMSVRSGKVSVEFKLTSTLSGTATVGVDSYIVSVLEPIVSYHETTESYYEISDISGFAGSATVQLSVTMEADKIIDVSKTSGTFSLSSSIECVVDGEATDEETRSLSAEKAAYLIDMNEFLHLFIFPENAEGYTADFSFDEDINFEGSLAFHGYFDPRGYYITDGTLEVKGTPANKEDGNFRRYTYNVSENDPLVFESAFGNDVYTISFANLETRVRVSTNIFSGTRYITDYYGGDIVSCDSITINGMVLNEMPEFSLTLADFGIRGSGTKDNPFKIEDERQLRGLASIVNHGNDMEGKYIRLTSDIDLDNRQWAPIGKTVSEYVFYNSEDEFEDDWTVFKGHFDGGNHTISNLSIVYGSRVLKSVGLHNAHLGLFGLVGRGASIENLTIENLTIDGSNLVGGFVALIPKTNDRNNQNPTVTTLKNLHLFGDVRITAESDAGGILGRASQDTSLVITDCTVSADNGSYIRIHENADNKYLFDNFFGGLIGTAYSGNLGYGKTVMSGCSVSGLDITGNFGILGGLAGHFEQGTISGVEGEPIVSDMTITLTGNHNNEEEPDVANRVGALLGTAINQANDTYTITLENIIVEDVTLNVPTETDIKIPNIIGCHRYRNEDHSDYESKFIGLADVQQNNIIVNRH